MKKTKRPVFKKSCKGMYFCHEYSMCLSHELSWFKGAVRKWELSYMLAYGITAPYKVTKKFDSMKEARDFANALVAKG